jgi:hypothetical protein
VFAAHEFNLKSGISGREKREFMTSTKLSPWLRTRSFVAAFLTLSLILFVPHLLAQSAGTAGLTGTVTDPSGAVVQNVTVTLTSSDTNQARTTTTNADGVYKFSLIPPGTYKVRFMASGFKPSEVSDLTLNVTETPELNGKLEVGTQSEQVLVEAAAEVLQTSSSSLGTTVNSVYRYRTTPGQSELYANSGPRGWRQCGGEQCHGVW